MNHQDNTPTFIRIDCDYFNKIGNIGKCCRWDYCWMNSEQVDMITLGVTIGNGSAIKYFGDDFECSSLEDLDKDGHYDWDKITINAIGTYQCMNFLRKFQDKINWNRVYLTFGIVNSLGNLTFNSQELNFLFSRMNNKVVSRVYIPVKILNSHINKINFNLLPYHKYSREDLIYIRSNLVKYNEKICKKLDYILYGIESKFTKREINDILKFDDIDKDFILKNKDRIRWKSFSKCPRFLELVPMDLIRFYQRRLNWKVLKMNKDIGVLPDEFKKYL